jgi:cytochrome c
MRTPRTRAGLLLIKFLVTSSTALAAGDPTAGEKIFASHCAVCHAPAPGENKIGPSLAGIVWSKSGTIPGLDFSAAMKA